MLDLPYSHLTQVTHLTKTRGDSLVFFFSYKHFRVTILAGENGIFLKKSNLLAKCVHRTEIEQNKNAFLYRTKKVTLIQRENLNKKNGQARTKKFLKEQSKIGGR